MPRRYDHIDLRVADLAKARPFYERLLPALGFARDARIEGWLQYEAAGHVPNENRIAFWADSVSEVDRLAKIIVRAGALNIEGPAYETPTYYAVFFEDPCGNRLELCHRTGSSSTT